MHQHQRRCFRNLTDSRYSWFKIDKIAITSPLLHPFIIYSHLFMQQNSILLLIMFCTIMLIELFEICSCLYIMHICRFELTEAKTKHHICKQFCGNCIWVCVTVYKDYTCRGSKSKFVCSKIGPSLTSFGTMILFRREHTTGFSSCSRAPTRFARTVNGNIRGHLSVP